MTFSLTSPEHLADVARAKKAVRDARAAFCAEVYVNGDTSENHSLCVELRNKVIEAEKVYHESCCCDPADYELFPHYITLGEQIRLQREIDQQYERVLLNMTSVCMDDFENPDISSYYVPADQVQKLLDQLQKQIEMKIAPAPMTDECRACLKERFRLHGIKEERDSSCFDCGNNGQENSDISFEEMLEDYSTVPERVKLIGVINVTMYFGSYTKAKWESVMFGPPMEMKEYSFRKDEASEEEESIRIPLTAEWVIWKIREIGGVEAFPTEGTKEEREYTALRLVMCEVMKSSDQESVDKLKEWHQMELQQVYGEIHDWLQIHPDEETEKLIVSVIERQHKN